MILFCHLVNALGLGSWIDTSLGDKVFLSNHLRFSDLLHAILSVLIWGLDCLFVNRGRVWRDDHVCWLLLGLLLHYISHIILRIPEADWYHFWVALPFILRWELWCLESHVLFLYRVRLLRWHSVCWFLWMNLLSTLLILLLLLLLENFFSVGRILSALGQPSSPLLILNLLPKLLVVWRLNESLRLVWWDDVVNLLLWHAFEVCLLLELSDQLFVLNPSNFLFWGSQVLLASRNFFLAFFLLR